MGVGYICGYRGFDAAAEPILELMRNDELVEIEFYDDASGTTMTYVGKIAELQGRHAPELKTQILPYIITEDGTEISYFHTHSIEIHKEASAQMDT